MADVAGTAVIVGAGPGLGSALARRFARAGMKVAVARRNAGELAGLTKELGAGVARRMPATRSTSRRCRSSSPR